MPQESGAINPEDRGNDDFGENGGGSIGPAPRTPHHGPAPVTGNKRGGRLYRDRAATQPGARDRAPRRMARKPSERSERPATEGKC